MLCRTCLELETSLQSARDPASPNLLSGLTAAGERNRAQQKREKIEKLETLLAKHRSICQISKEQTLAAAETQA